MTIKFDAAETAHRGGSPLLASNRHGNPITATLFAYVCKGALDEARVALRALLDHLQKDKTRLGPDEGTLAAYVLYKLRSSEAGSTISLLLEKYPMLPDLQVLKGVQFIGEGKAEQAAEYFNVALAQGVPTYTEGVRLLRDGLNFLCDFYPDDQDIRASARRAGAIATAANFNSELTCLRLGQDIYADFLLD